MVQPNCFLNAELVSSYLAPWSPYLLRSRDQAYFGKWMSKPGTQEPLEPVLGYSQYPFWLDGFLIISVVEYFDYHPEVLLLLTLRICKNLENKVKQVTQR